MWFTIVSGIVGGAVNTVTSVLGAQQREKEAAAKYEQTVQKNQKLIRYTIIAVVLLVIILLIVKFRKK